MERMEIEGLEPRPEWWRVRPEEITAMAAASRRGRAKVIAKTPAGYPVWTVTYGGEAPTQGTASWCSAAMSGGNADAYKPRADGPQTVLVLCGVHGAEAEAVAGAVNMMALMETGRDLRGMERPGLVDLARDYRLILVPCLNMDGRAVSPDHLRGAGFEDFRRASQGWWKDGSLIGWPECKRHAPLLKEKVGHFGGYPNSDGYNIMHDCCPGDIRTEEAAALLKLVAREQVDLFLNCHSHGNPPVLLSVSSMSYPLHQARGEAYQRRVCDALAEAGLRPKEPKGGHGPTLNLNTGAMLASGALAATFEQPVGDGWTFDEMLETFYVLVETFLRGGREEPFSPRDRLNKTE